MKPFYTLGLIVLSSFFIHVKATDTCTVNDVCFTAIDFPALVSDASTICLTGCNMYASPDPDVQDCYMGDFPTVWYRLTTDSAALVMNIEVYSADIVSPAFALFKGTNGCDQLEQISLTQGSDCILGADGIAKVIGVEVDEGTVYYLAVSSLVSIGGNFDICINTLSQGFVCVVDRNIEITARSNGGPLEGPYAPNETVSICYNVNHYTAANNGCQWFQGIVPVFGNGWDPSSFDSLGQPLVATINGLPFSTSGNGNYGVTNWSWQDSVGYHHDHPTYSIGDFDNNGRMDICNGAHESDCPIMGGLPGGCCGPCWDSAGTVLPAGWFAKGINGSCSDTNYIAEEWGDGNTCGSGMGPWSFCFDLVTRDVDDCMTDSTYSDLTLGYYTFADGEIGAWIGGASVCALDVPAKISSIGLCGRIVQGGNDDLPEHCDGDTLRYLVDEENITDWEWNISPFEAVPYLPNKSENGFLIEAPLVNNTGQPIPVTATLVGRTEGSGDVLIRKFNFTLRPDSLCTTTSDNTPGSVDETQLQLYPIPADESFVLQWYFDLQQDATISMYNAQGERIQTILVDRSEGRSKRIACGDIPSGLYYVHFYNRDFRYVRKMIRA